MKKILNSNNTLYFSHTFPLVKKYSQKSLKKCQKINTITLGVGGNIGDVVQRFKQLLQMLQTDARFDVQGTSPILKNPPFGYIEQAFFYNAIIVLKTQLSPIACLNACQRYEYRFKRTRSFQDAPRTLDIDIIFYNNLKMNTKRLILPHKGYKNRNSVLIPLHFMKSNRNNRNNLKILS